MEHIVNGKNTKSATDRNTFYVSFHIDERHLELIDDLAKASEASRSSIIRFAIRKYMPQLFRDKHIKISLSKNTLKSCAISVNERLKDRIDSFSEGTGIAKSVIIRESINAFLLNDYAEIMGRIERRHNNFR